MLGIDQILRLLSAGVGVAQQALSSQLAAQLASNFKVR